MKIVKSIDRFADRMIEQGGIAWKASGTGAKAVSVLGSVVTAPVGTAGGAVLGAGARLASSFDGTRVGTIEEHGRRGDPGFKQTITMGASNLDKTYAAVLIPTAFGAAVAGTQIAYSLATGAGPWSLTGGIAIGFLVGVATWLANSLIRGAWNGGKKGFKAGVGASRVLAHKLLGGKNAPQELRQEPPRLQLPAAREAGQAQPARLVREPAVIDR